MFVLHLAVSKANISEHLVIWALFTTLLEGNVKEHLFLCPELSTAQT